MACCAVFFVCTGVLLKRLKHLDRSQKLLLLSSAAGRIKVLCGAEHTEAGASVT